MSIIAAFMVPHPPLIVPEVGRGGESQIRKTTDSYIRVAKEIAELSPDTIVISSPHAAMYYDYLHISPGNFAEGSFAAFRAPQVHFSETYDTGLVEEITKLAKETGLNAGTKGGRSPELDHGTMVPLYFIRKFLPSCPIVRIGLAGLPLKDHYKLGILIQNASDNVNRRVVYVASGDLSHKLQESGPYGFIKEGPEYDRRIMDVCSRGAFGELFDFPEEFCDKAAECGHRSFVIMAGALDGYSVRATQYSHEDITGVGYGICSFYPTGKDSARHFSDYGAENASEDPYVALARKTIQSYVTNGTLPDIPANLPDEMLHKKAGAFVSIHKKDRLRGCIGTILATTGSVAEEIIQNAVSASTRDPRFPAITEEELPDLDISVDILEEPEDISSPEELDVKRYGVIVTRGFRRGLLLPDLEGVDTVEEQILISKRKAGIGDDEDVKLQRFEVIRHH